MNEHVCFALGMIQIVFDIVFKRARIDWKLCRAISINAKLIVNSLFDVDLKIMFFIVCYWKRVKKKTLTLFYAMFEGNFAINDWE